MQFLRIRWDDEADPDGNVQHVAEHGLTIADVEHVLALATREGVSRASGLPAVWGYTPAGEYIIVVFERPEPDAIYPITAYEVPEPK